MIEIRTERLLLRMFRESDLDEYAAMMAEPEVIRYLGSGNTLTRADTWRQIAIILGHWQLRGYGFWALEELATGRLVGRTGIFEPEGWPGFELGWALAPWAWGKGYATEAARAALKDAFERLGRDHVISLIAPENVRSIRVAERLGERLEGKTTLPMFDREVLIYGISRSEFESSAPR